jgi:hypothetical protein
MMRGRRSARRGEHLKGGLGEAECFHFINSQSIGFCIKTRPALRDVTVQGDSIIFSLDSSKKPLAQNKG